MKFKKSIIVTIFVVFIAGFLFFINESFFKIKIGKKINNIMNDTLKPQKADKYTYFEIAQISDITSKDVTSASFIKTRLEALIGNSMKEKCDSLGVKYPPSFVVFRMFKAEREFEIWVSGNRKDSMKLLAILPVCAVDYVPGTKLQSGDGKTPEGFFNCDLMYGSSYAFMWINLNNSKIDDFGNVGNGCSSFKICTDYPHSIDRQRTKKILGNVSSGGEICIHGNCVTAGCISFKNENFLPVFLASAFHNQNAFGKIKIHIYPFRFSEQFKKHYSQNVSSELNQTQLLNFWNELEKGYNLFENSKKAFSVLYSDSTYIFKSY